MEPSDLLRAEGPVIRADGNGWKAEEIAELLSPPGFFSAVLDGAAARDKKSLLAALAAALKFPSYFGHNWDALLDCLRSLPEFAPADGYALVVRDSARLLEAAPAELDAFMEIVGDAAAFLLEKYRKPLKVVLL